VSWHGNGLALDFAADAVEDAVTLVAGDTQLPGFAIGIAQGELSVVIEAGSKVVLSNGPALIAATALARVARAGEVLVDPAFSALASGELMTSGSRLAQVAGRRLRALLLDRQIPWRTVATEAVRRLVSNPARLGALDPGDLVLAPGTLAVVRADEGYGGSRLLADLAQAHGWAQLMVSAPPVGEPLGALRRAMLRARATHGEPALPPEHTSLLDSLLAGEGLDVVDSETLLGAWFSGAPTGGLALLDGAGEIDADTLAALAQSCADGSLSIVARLGFSESLPGPLAELTLAGEVVIDGLDRDQALELAKHFCAGALYDRGAARYIAARGGTPLGVELSLCDGLENAALVWDPERALLRARGTARGPALPLQDTVLARLARLDPESSAVITVLAVLGGEAELPELEAIVTQVHGPLELQKILAELAAARWVRLEGELVALPSRLYRRALLSSLAPESLLELHRVIASVFEASTRPLAAASASLHALLGGRGGDAERLARQAAASAEAAGLAATSEALEEYALNRAHAPLFARGMAGPWSWDAPPASRRFSALSEIGPASEDAPSGRAAVALREGDLATIDEIVGSLRAEASDSALADRLEAMAGLARGETGTPLGLLKNAKERAKDAGSAERCRAALALGIALAAAGRETDALLEALDALARAREAADARGERACSRFLAQLSRGAGDEAAAGLWDRAVIR